VFLLLDRDRHLSFAVDSLPCIIADTAWNLQMYGNVYAFLSLMAMLLLSSAYLVSNIAQCDTHGKIKSIDTVTVRFGSRLRTLIMVGTILIASASLPSVAFGYEVRMHI
jgi:hypothetical protein